jgi:hypothetical protein
MAKTGRPPLVITDEIIEKAESLAASGLTMEEIADCLNMGSTTLYEKKIEYPEFAAAIKRGKSKGIGMMANNLVELAKAGNAAANIFFLKSRAGWREDAGWLNELHQRMEKLEKGESKNGSGNS